MTEVTLSPEEIKDISKKIEETTGTLFWDYNDTLTKEQIEKIIDGKYFEVSDEVHQNNQEYIWEVESSEKINIINTELSLKGYRLSESQIKEISSTIFEGVYPSIDENLDRLISNVGNVAFRVAMNSNYDCINSHAFEAVYEYKGYFRAMIDQLNLNPKKVMRYLKKKRIKTHGSFRNKRRRNGKEYVSYEDFIQEIDNSSAPANLLVFIGMVDISDFEKGKAVKVTIPKGNSCGLFSDSYGGGSLIEMKLLRDKKIDLTKPYAKSKYDTYSLLYDKGDNGYGIDECFGVVESFFGKKLTLEIEEIKPE